MCKLIGDYLCSCGMAVFSQGWRVRVPERTVVGIVHRVPPHDPVWPEGDDIIRICQCSNRLAPGGPGQQYGFWELCPETRASMIDTEARLAQGNGSWESADTR